MDSHLCFKTLLFLLLMADNVTPNLQARSLLVSPIEWFRIKSSSSSVQIWWVFVPGLRTILDLSTFGTGSSCIEVGSSCLISGAKFVNYSRYARAHASHKSCVVCFLPSHRLIVQCSVSFVASLNSISDITEQHLSHVLLILSIPICPFHFLKYHSHKTNRMTVYQTYIQTNRYAG